MTMDVNNYFKSFDIMTGKSGSTHGAKGRGFNWEKHNQSDKFS